MSLARERYVGSGHELSRGYTFRLAQDRKGQVDDDDCTAAARFCKGEMFQTKPLTPRMPPMLQRTCCAPPVSHCCLSAFVVSDALVSLVVEKKSQKRLGE